MGNSLAGLIHDQGTIGTWFYEVPEHASYGRKRGGDDRHEQKQGLHKLRIYAGVVRERQAVHPHVVQGVHVVLYLSARLYKTRKSLHGQGEQLHALKIVLFCGPRRNRVCLSGIATLSEQVSYKELVQASVQGIIRMRASFIGSNDSVIFCFLPVKEPSFFFRFRNYVPAGIF